MVIRHFSKMTDTIFMVNFDRRIVILMFSIRTHSKENEYGKFKFAGRIRIGLCLRNVITRQRQLHFTAKLHFMAIHCTFPTKNINANEEVFNEVSTF